MDLTALVDGDDAHDRLCLPVAREQHRTRVDALRGHRIRERRPTQAVVVLRVQIGYEIKIVHGGTALVVRPHDTG